MALDLDGRITLANRYASTILGWTSKELLGRDWVETCVPARARDALRRLRDIVAGNLSVAKTPCSRGRIERLIEWHNTVQRDDAGRVIGTFSFRHGHHERRRAEDALRTAEERMRLFARCRAPTSGSGTWTTRRECFNGPQPSRASTG